MLVAIVFLLFVAAMFIYATLVDSGKIVDSNTRIIIESIILLGLMLTGYLTLLLF